MGTITESFGQALSAEHPQRILNFFKTSETAVLQNAGTDYQLSFNDPGFKWGHLVEATAYSSGTATAIAAQALEAAHWRVVRGAVTIYAAIPSAVFDYWANGTAKGGVITRLPRRPNDDLLIRNGDIIIVRFPPVDSNASPTALLNVSARLTVGEYN